jgi:predicted nucleic acid-binding protein
VLVVDASVLVVALADDGVDGDKVRLRLRGEELAAPELIDLEVVSVLSRQLSVGSVDRRRADFAVADLLEMPMTRVSHRRLIRRRWELRDNLTAYDSAYVCLAEMLGSTLLTGDRRLARAPGLRCAVELLA